MRAIFHAARLLAAMVFQCLQTESGAATEGKPGANRAGRGLNPDPDPAGL